MSRSAALMPEVDPRHMLGDEVRALQTVIAACLTPAGVVLDANQAFSRIVGAPAPEALRGTNAARFIRLPTLEDLVTGQLSLEGAVFEGRITFGDAMNANTYTSRASRSGGILRIVGERDLNEIERLDARLTQLTGHSEISRYRLSQRFKRLQQRQTQAVEASYTDPLTGVGNRRRLDVALEVELAREARCGTRLSLLVIDVDHFKRVNDTFGHVAGDEVLRSVATMLRTETRPTDIVTRYGGEEFVVLMPHTDLETGAAAAERLRQAIARQPVGSAAIRVTVSAGVASARIGDTPAAILARGDAALYQAKHSGRDRVCVG